MHTILLVYQLFSVGIIQRTCLVIYGKTIYEYVLSVLFTIVGGSYLVCYVIYKCITLYMYGEYNLFERVIELLMATFNVQMRLWNYYLQC